MSSGELEVFAFVFVFVLHVLLQFRIEYSIQVQVPLYPEDPHRPHAAFPGQVVPRPPPKKARFFCAGFWCGGRLHNAVGGSASGTASSGTGHQSSPVSGMSPAVLDSNKK